MRYTSRGRRRALHALLATTTVPALSVLAQPQTSPPPTAPAAPAPGGDAGSSAPPGTIGIESRGVASRERQQLGEGPVSIALWIPPESGIYRRASQALAAGVRAAHARDGGQVKLEIIEIDEDPISLRALYDELQQRGFSLVLGPLTRNAVSLIAEMGAPPVLTLALNQPQSGTLPPNMVAFSLSIETEARQVAAIAIQQAAAVASAASRRPRAAVIQNTSSLGRRSAVAFAERWRELGGDVYEPIEIEAAAAGRVRTLLSRARADVYFVGASPAVAGAVKLAIAGRGLVYGTSQLNTGAAAGGNAEPAALAFRSPELDGVRLVDMPWQLQPDHIAVMAYQRPAGMHLELQRLYALGVDAFRFGQQMLAAPPPVELDGVTGHLRLASGSGTVERTALPAEYRDGVAIPAVQP